MTAKKLDCTKYSNDKMKWNKSEQRLKRHQSRPIWGSACKHGWSSLKTDIECNKEAWICMILESFRQWCSKSLMHNTRSGLEYVCVLNKISRLLVLTLIVNFRVSLHSPSSPCYTCSRFSVISDDREDMVYYTVQWVKIFFLLKNVNSLVSFSW